LLILVVFINLYLSKTIVFKDTNDMKKFYTVAIAMMLGMTTSAFAVTEPTIKNGKKIGGGIVYMTKVDDRRCDTIRITERDCKESNTEIAKKKKKSIKQKIFDCAVEVRLTCSA